MLLDVVYETISNKQIISSSIFYKILNIYKNYNLNFVIKNVYETFEVVINNSLENYQIDIEVFSNYIELKLPKCNFYTFCFNELIFIDNLTTKIIVLNINELNFVKYLIENDCKIDISEVKDTFFSEIYPKIKNITKISEELMDNFPIFDVKINTFIDFKNKKLVFKN